MYDSRIIGPICNNQHKEYPTAKHTAVTKVEIRTINLFLNPN